MSASARYLIPRPRGVALAMRARANDGRRRLVLALLRGDVSIPAQLGEIGRLARLSDAQSVGAFLFRLQREEWVDGDVQPLRLPSAPLAEALPALLGELSTGRCAVLGTAEGLACARVGFEAGVADRIAALSADLGPLLDRVALEEGEAGASGVFGLINRLRLTIMPLRLGARRFSLAVGDEPRLESDALVQLAALLARRYERGGAA